MISPSRAVAAEVLTRVFTTDAFATAALDGMLARAGLHERDAALAAELVYGVLRTEAFLDEQILAVSHRGGYDKEARARAHLLMGAYSLAFLDRVPSFAAVSEAVTGVRAASTDRDAAFANAVLRRPRDGVVGEAPRLRRCRRRVGAWLAPREPPPIARPIGCTRVPCGGPRAPSPRALLRAKRGSRGVGPAVERGRARRRDRARSRVTPRDHRPRCGRSSPLARLRGGLDRHGRGRSGRRPRDGRRAWRARPRCVRGPREQDLAPRAGGRARRRGQAPSTRPISSPRSSQTSSEAPRVRSSGRRSPSTGPRRSIRSRRASRRASSTTSRLSTRLARASARSDAAPRLGRRRTLEDIARLADLQFAISLRVAARVRDGGRLVFATCSVLKEEAEEVMARLVAAREGDMRLEPALPEPRRLLPNVEGTDGYFVAGLRVRREKR